MNNTRSFSMRNTSFKKMILGLFAASLLLLLTLFALMLWFAQQADIKDHLTRLRHAVDISYQNAIAAQADMLTATLSAIQADPRYFAPFEARNREALLALAHPLFTQLHDGEDITHMYFITPEREVFLRAHLPLSHGDKLERYTLLQAEKDNRVARGIELGKTGTFTLRVVMPWHVNGKLIGYIELGKELEPVAAQVAKAQNAQIAVVIDKNLLNRHDWEVGMAMLGRPALWEQFGSDVLVGGSMPELPASISQRLPDWRTTTPEQLETLHTDNGKYWTLTHLPIRDAGNNAVGSLLLIMDSTPHHREIRNTLMMVVGGGLLGGTLLLLLFNLILSRVETRLAAAENEKQRAQQFQDMLGNVTSVLDSMGDGLLVTDGAGRIEQANPALLQLFTLEGPQAGKPARDVLGDEVGQFVQQALQSQGTHDSSACEVQLPGKGVAKVMATQLRTTTADAGPVRGAVFTFRDITREVEISRMKTDFIANVSHELRTPLTSVLGFAKLLRKQFQQHILPALGQPEGQLAKTAGKVQSHLDIIVSEGERLTHLINDVLDLTKIEAGKVEWRDERIDMAALLAHAQTATAGLFNDKHLSQQLDISAGMPAVQGDPDRLLQVVINLLSNAAKFTQQGTVTCRARLQGSNLVVSVQDEGCGISPTDQQHLFERFRQVGDTMTSKPTGTGLGLAICKQIVEHHHGRIWVESTPDAGSTFSFSLPVTAGAEIESDSDAGAAVAAPVQSSVTGARTVLVVDDEANIRELLRQELEAGGYQVIEARDGIEAIRLAKRDRPNLILLDIMMPGMNGFEVAAVLRSAPETSDLPIMILSIVDDRPRGKAVGADSYLSKPIDVDVLLGEIDTLLNQRSSHKHVMVVDENEDTVNSLRAVLTTKGYQVEVLPQQLESPRIQDLLSRSVVLSGSPGQTARIVASLEVARGQEHILLLVSSHTEQDAATDGQA